MSLAKKLMSGSAIQVTNLLLEIIIGFILMPFLVTELTEKWYGLWLLVGSVVSFFGILTLGLSSAVQRFLSVEISAKNIDQYKRTVSSSIFVFSLIGLAGILFSIFIGLCSQYFVDDKELLTVFEILIVIMGCNFALKFATTPFRAALTAEFKFLVVTGIDIFNLIFKTILTVWFITAGFGVISIGMGMLIAEIVSAIVFVSYVLINLESFTFRRHYIEKNKVIELYKYGLDSFIASLGEMLRFPLGNIIISSFVGLSSVTVYSIPVRLLSYANAFILQSVGVLQPFFTKLYAEKNLQQLQSQFFRANYISFGLGGVLAGGLFIFGANFIGLWVGQYEETKILTLILPFTILFGVSQHPSVMVLYTLGKHKYYAYQNVVEALFNVALSLVLIEYYGVAGVALGVVIPMFITKIIFLPKYVCQQLEVSSTRYYYLLVKAMVFTLIYSLFWVMLRVDTSSWLLLTVWALVYAIAFFILYLFIVIDKPIRNKLLIYCSGKFGIKIS